MPYRRRNLKRRFHRKLRRASRPGKFFRRTHNTFGPRNRHIIKPLQPSTQTIKLRYVDHVSLNGDGNISQWVFRANSIYDPDYSGTGHQPLGHDQMGILYDHYTVLGGRIKCRFWTEDAATTYGAVCGIMINDDALIAADIRGVMERGSPYTKTKMIRMNAGASPSVTTVTNWFSAKKFFGLSKVKDVDSVSAAMGSNPAECAFYSVFYQHPDVTTDLPSIHCNVEIDYIVQFSEPRDLAMS